MDLQLLLEARGWRVIGPASTVGEALTLLEAELPTVALLDVRLRNDELVTPVALALAATGVPFAVATAYSRPERYGGRVLAGIPNAGKPTSEHCLLAALNQLVGESQVDVEYTTISGSTTSQATGTRTTTFSYDGVGNRTLVVDAAGAATHTFYDANGRITAVAAPQRDVDGTDTTTLVTPLTVMQRDAFGNLVRQVEYAAGASSLIGATPTPIVTAAVV